MSTVQEGDGVERDLIGAGRREMVRRSYTICMKVTLHIRIESAARWSNHCGRHCTLRKQAERNSVTANRVGRMSVQGVALARNEGGRNWTTDTASCCVPVSDAMENVG